jgi:hypothetical protein
MHEQRSEVVPGVGLQRVGARRVGLAVTGLIVAMIGVSILAALPVGPIHSLFTRPSPTARTRTPQAAALATSTSQPGAPASGLLPGEQLWPNGVSSLLFGINETYDYSDHNLENTPTAQQALKSAGFTLVRSFFSEQHMGWPSGHSLTTDADLELRFQAIENSGATCLGVLAVSGNSQYNSSLQFLDHVLTYAETSRPGPLRCQLWEYGNEPYGPMSMATYIARWSHDIAYLRARHPRAKFIGWVDSGPYTDHLQAFLRGVKSTGVLPDAVSYHDYPCYNSPDYPDTPSGAQACDKRIQQGGDGLPGYADCIRQIKQVVRQVLGRDLPVGITEWNVSPNFVNLVNGQLPLTVSPTYQPHFIQEMYAAMAAAHLDFATQFDAMSGAGEGGTASTPSGTIELSLDLIQSNGSPRPWLNAYLQTIAAYRSGRA